MVLIYNLRLNLELTGKLDADATWVLLPSLDAIVGLLAILAEKRPCNPVSRPHGLTRVVEQRDHASNGHCAAKMYHSLV